MRPPHPEEVKRLTALFDQAKAAYAKDSAKALKSLEKAMDHGFADMELAKTDGIEPTVQA